MGNEPSSDQQVNERQLERIFATQWEGQQTLLLKKNDRCFCCFIKQNQNKRPPYFFSNNYVNNSSVFLHFKYCTVSVKFKK